MRIARNFFPPAPRLSGALLAGACCLWPFAACQAQDNAVPPQGAATTGQVTALSSIELWLAFAIIAFGLVVLGMQFVLLRRTASPEPDDVLRLFTVTLIVIGTLALIAIGYSSQQIAPALGLFGTILGYLLGKSDERMRERRAATREGAARTEPERPT